MCGGWGGDYEATVDSKGAEGSVWLVQVQKIQWGCAMGKRENRAIVGGGGGHCRASFILTTDEMLFMPLPFKSAKVDLVSPSPNIQIDLGWILLT